MTDVKPGQVYDRAGVVAVVLRLRNAKPEGWQLSRSVTKSLGIKVWWDVPNLASDTSQPFHEPGKIVAWEEGMFEPRRSKRIA